MSTKKKTYNEKQKKAFQRRLANFFKKYKDKNDILSKDLGKSLGYASAGRFSELEHDYIPHPRFINSLEFLDSIASLEENKSLWEFIRYLEGKSSEESKESTDKDDISLFMEKIPLKLRKRVRKVCSEANEDPKAKKRLQAMLELLIEGFE